MFIGSYSLKLEEKGRMSIPKKFRPELASGGVISAGLDGCLFIYSKESWQKLFDKLESLPLTQSESRLFTRSLSYMAEDINMDSIGRILIPENLRKYYNISSDVVLAGALNRIELWNKKEYEEYMVVIKESSAKLAEKINI